MSKNPERAIKIAYKYCFVPGCGNTTIKTPTKTFIYVPRSEDIRAVWCRAANYEGNLRLNSHICEDHFKLEEDLDNYMEWKTRNCLKKLKEGAYPRFFSCQLATSTTIQFSSSSGPPSAPSDKKIGNVISDKNRKSLQPGGDSPMQCGNPASSVSSLEPTPGGLPAAIDCSLLEPSDGAQFSNISSESTHVKKQQNPERSRLRQRQRVQHVKRLSASVDRLSIDRAVQAISVVFEKGVQMKPRYRSVAIDCQLKYIPGLLKNVETSPIKSFDESQLNSTGPEAVDERLDKISGIKMNSTGTTSSSSDWVKSQVSNNSSTPSDSDLALKMEHLKGYIFENVTKLIIEDNPLASLGLPKNSMYVLEEFLSVTKCSRRNTYLTLKKIRQNIPNAILSYEFGVSESQISRTFRSTLGTMRDKFQQLIIWPTRSEISLNLLIQFRQKYANVQSTIDCLEIEIEHLSDAVHQAATCSDYKKCNTAKYLISVTPDGLINFISKGFGGHTSDMEVVKNSGYLSVLPTGASVLADRGFKQLDTVLRQKKCKLLRPPSVQTDEIMSEEDAMKTKEIASVRIHVERVIRRLREFKMLQPHVTLDHNLLEVMDDVVIVAAAIVNIQSKITR